MTEEEKVISEANFQVRRRVYKKLREWAKEGKIKKSPSHDFTHLAWLFNKTYQELADIRDTPAITQVIDALAGPNGWCIYKVMLIRKKHD